MAFKAAGNLRDQVRILDIDVEGFTAPKGRTPTRPRPQTSPSASGKGASLKRLRASYSWKGWTYNMAELSERTFTSELLILKNDRIVTETYHAESSPRTRFFGYSLAKSITSTLMGMAIDDGFIQSVDDSLSRYLPELAWGRSTGCP